MIDIHAHDMAMLTSVGYDLETGIRHAQSLYRITGKPVAASKVLRMASGKTGLKGIRRYHIDAFNAVYSGAEWLATPKWLSVRRA